MAWWMYALYRVPSSFRWKALCPCICGVPLLSPKSRTHARIHTYIIHAFMHAYIYIYTHTHAHIHCILLHVLQSSLVTPPPPPHTHTRLIPTLSNRIRASLIHTLVIKGHGSPDCHWYIWYSTTTLYLINNINIRHTPALFLLIVWIKLIFQHLKTHSTCLR